MPPQYNRGANIMQFGNMMQKEPTQSIIHINIKKDLSKQGNNPFCKS